MWPCHTDQPLPPPGAGLTWSGRTPSQNILFNSFPVSLLGWSFRGSWGWGLWVGVHEKAGGFGPGDWGVFIIAWSSPAPPPSKGTMACCRCSSPLPPTAPFACGGPPGAREEASHHTHAADAGSFAVLLPCAQRTARLRPVRDLLSCSSGGGPLLCSKWSLASFRSWNACSVLTAERPAFLPLLWALFPPGPQ